MSDVGLNGISLDPNGDDSDEKLYGLLNIKYPLFNEMIFSINLMNITIQNLTNGAIIKTNNKNLIEQ